MHVIYSFGDSITYGAWDMMSSGWSARLRQYLDQKQQKPAFYYYSLGIHGETTHGLRSRFSQEVTSRKRHDDNSYTFIFAYGANDATWLTDKNRFKANIIDFEENLKSAIQESKKMNANVFLLEITPVNEKYSANISERKKSCLNEYVDSYNACIHNIVNRGENVSLIQVNDLFKQSDLEKTLQKDGLHPSTLGHDIIFESVKTSIDPLLTKLAG